MNIKKIIGVGFILLGTRLAICIIKKLLQNGNSVVYPEPWMYDEAQCWEYEWWGHPEKWDSYPESLKEKFRQDYRDRNEYFEEALKRTGQFSELYAHRAKYQL